MVRGSLKTSCEEKFSAVSNHIANRSQLGSLVCCADQTNRLETLCRPRFPHFLLYRALIGQTGFPLIYARSGSTRGKHVWCGATKRFLLRFLSFLQPSKPPASPKWSRLEKISRAAKSEPVNPPISVFFSDFFVCVAFNTFNSLQAPVVFGRSSADVIPHTFIALEDRNSTEKHPSSFLSLFRSLLQHSNNAKHDGIYTDTTTHNRTHGSV